jgi:multidrug efflux pump subunit AcrA (membrane-fusion protein)
VSRLVPVEVELTGAGVRQVKPGFLTRATFSSNVRENALLVPSAAVVVSGGASVVYLVKGGRARRQNVRPGLTYAGNMEILDGVIEADTVIVAGNTSVRDGGLVKVVDAAVGDSLSSAIQGSGEEAGSEPGRGRGGD